MLREEKGQEYNIIKCKSLISQKPYLGHTAELCV